ncbi:hypothetical protein FACS1894196_2970 [Clostridia bacterium]|nr:hypothetical protein FACS1894196_2970 [Clostridia bacterium]
MKESYIPAIVTGIAGIFGILINVSVNTWYRHSDSREKKKSNDIDAYEKFFVPLSRLLKDLCDTQEALRKSNPAISPTLICSYLSGSEVTPPELSMFITQLTDNACAISTLANSDSYKMVTDYKAKFYLARVLLFVDGIVQSKQKRHQIVPSEYHYDDIKRLVNRIDWISVKLFSTNLFTRIYLSVWKHIQMHKRVK